QRAADSRLGQSHGPLFPLDRSVHLLPCREIGRGGLGAVAPGLLMSTSAQVEIRGEALEPRTQPREPLWLFAAAGVLLIGAAVAYAWFTIFSRPMSPDEGYLMITIQSFLEGAPLYDSVFTQYGPAYYFYEWLLKTVLAVPLTHDATRMLGIIHWLATALALG